MKIKLRKKDKDYAQVHRNMLFNPCLSLKAKGLGSILEIYSDDFELSEKTLINKSKDGKRALKTGIKELEKQDYLFRIQTHDEIGQFTTVWIFDSELIHRQYVEQIISDLKNINILTTVGTLCTIGTKCGTALTASGKCTPYNNNSKYNNSITTTTYKEKAKEYGLQDETGFEFEFEKFKNYNSNNPEKINIYYWELWLINYQRNEVEIMRCNKKKGA